MLLAVVSSAIFFCFFFFVYAFFCFFFFFSSRRRHTRSLCDWSSDVCSSDLISTSRDVSDLSPLAGLKSLAELDAYGNESVVDIKPLAGLTSLTNLRLYKIGRASCRERV